MIIKTRSQKAFEECIQSQKEDYTCKIEAIRIMYEEESQIYEEYLGLQSEIEKNRKMLGEKYKLLKRRVGLKTNIYKRDLEMLNNNRLIIQVYEKIEEFEKKGEDPDKNLLDLWYNLFSQNDKLDEEIELYQNLEVIDN